MAPEPTSHRVIEWLPRIFCIAVAAFLAMFSFDVFDEPVSPARKLVALLIHLIPTFGVLLFLWLSWRREWIGAIVFPLLAVLHLVTMWGKLDWSGYVGIEVPLLLLAGLYWVAWRARKGSTPPANASPVAS